MKYLSLLFLALSLAACGQHTREADPLFTLLPSDSTGVTFTNEIVEHEGFNVLEYEYFYNGAGVAAGDVNGDGLPDLYFTANMQPDRLYMNRGDLHFEDVTEKAGLQHEPSWTTGVTMADVNGDGHLDIYVCRSGRVSEERRRNKLYINSGDGTFSEQAAAYGLDDPSYSNHATFFDYDRDGDLDLFLLNHPIRRFSNFDVRLIKRGRDPLAGDKLYRNDGGAFVDVSDEAGIIGNPLGFGLAASVSDINQDGWPDLYVANDYIEDDYLYINNGDGTFSERIRSYLTHTSYSSMGTDIADLNNDGHPDIVTLDMLAEDNRRQKLLKGPEDFAYYRQMRQRGFHEQYMRNMLHVNNGDGTFSEIGQFAGVSNTDWSWAPLFADFDNDGHKDLLVTNGYLRDYTNLDFLEFTLTKAIREASARGEALSSQELVKQMPSTVLRNYVFQNKADLTFRDATRTWGLDQPAHSSGAAYADLDNDGDLDIVINNINREAFVYRNEAGRQTQHHFLKVRLEGSAGNTFGIGARVMLTGPQGQQHYQEQIPARGYQSAVEPVLLFGLGEADQVDVTVTWPDGTQQTLPDVAANQTITVRQQEAVPAAPPAAPDSPPSFTYVPDAQGLQFVHQENAFADFEHAPLLPHMLSRLGPALATGDVNRDGLDDVFIGGAQGQAPQLFFQQADGSFRPLSVEAFDAHRNFEDVAALLIDVDQDNDPDLYVVSGGSFAESESPAYQDRLYLNNGFGAFTHAPDALPDISSSGGAVAAHDFDGDGDVDLFVGGRVLPGRYPYAPRSYLLENMGGQFRDVTAAASEALLQPGLVTDAAWADLDGDDKAELLLAGEWMPIRVFRHEGGVFSEITDQAGLQKTGGWWNTLAVLDLDGDGDRDLVAGNRGLNAQMQATPDTPARIHAADFDGSGSVDAIMSAYNQGESYPVPTRDELIEQLPGFASRFPTYASYAEATTDDLFTDDERKKVRVLHAHTFATTVFENRGDGTFDHRPLPAAAQFAPVRSILPGDLDGNDLPDLLLAGNDFTVRPQWGRQQAGQGLVLLNKGEMTFDVVPASRSGLYASGDVRHLDVVRTPAGPLVLVANNNADVTAFLFRPGALRKAP